ncbi:alpha/beta fold hydrolase [Actinomadura sp. ATCC 31491]|uniref:Alpha/beta fold hydrolase n=1 Tax=Actinomadura luzonensis TaxID=2805427 RepID=A0ABT0G7S0_9ACTN|nr:alpha/beta fold hydrolase [Actinomadura luzonensis]MCK2220644.1 alpha/beta fold hydrolase [Actinomadura luzonensis]
MDIFELGDLPLASGATLPGARLAYQTFGELNAAKDNVVVFPTFLGAPAEVLNGWIGENRALDPRTHFIVLPGHFGNPPSSAPSNTAGDFPEVSIADDVVAQQRLLEEVFGVREVRLALGWSIGAIQVYEWALRFPGLVRAIAPIAGAPTPPPWTKLWLRTVVEEPIAARGRDGLAQVAHGSALTAPPRTFYYPANETWRSLGFDSVDAFVAGFWEGFWLPQDPADVAVQARKSRTAWPGAEGEAVGDMLGRIKARTSIAAFTGDALFPPDELREYAEAIPGATFRQIDSVFGHLATFGLAEPDVKAIDDVIRHALES